MKVVLKYPVSTGLENRTVVARVGDLVDDIHPAQRTRAVVDQQKQQSMIGFLAEGATGIVKSSLRIGVATKRTIEKRRAVCDSCAFRDGGACTKCGCNIKSKTSLSAKFCPEGFWGVEQPS